MLLEIDGLNKGWDQGYTTSDWEGDLGNIDEEDLDAYVPFAMRRLHNPAGSRNYDTSGMGRGDDSDQEDDDSEPEQEDSEPNQEDGAPDQVVGPRIVRHLTQDFFRARLIEHFDILWNKNQVVWPRSVKK